MIFNAADLMKDMSIEVTVKFSNAWRIRRWFGFKLLRMAFYVMQMGTVHIKDQTGIDCGNECGYTDPYGFVPEAGCPVHDPDDWES